MPDVDVAAELGVDSSETLEDIDWEKLDEIDTEQLVSVTWNTFEDGKIDDAEAEELGAGAIMTGGQAVASAFGIPPELSGKILGPLSEHVGKPLGRAVKKGVDTIRGWFGRGGKAKPIRIVDQPGTYMGPSSLVRGDLVEPLVAPTVEALQRLHHDLGLGFRYWPDDVLRALGERHGLALKRAEDGRRWSSSLDASHPDGEHYAFRREIEQNPEVHLRYQAPYDEGELTYWIPDLWNHPGIPQGAGPDAYAAMFSGSEGHRPIDELSQRTREWAAKFVEAAAKEQQRLGMLAAAAEAIRNAPRRVQRDFTAAELEDLAAQKREGAALVDSWPGSYERYRRNAKRSAQGLSDILDEVSRYHQAARGNRNTAEWMAFAELSGPNATRPAWWTEYFGARLEGGSKVARDVAAWFDENEGAGLAALGEAMDFAWERWKRRYWNDAGRWGDWMRFALEHKPSAPQVETVAEWMSENASAEPNELAALSKAIDFARRRWLNPETEMPEDTRRPNARPEAPPELTRQPPPVIGAPSRPMSRDGGPSMVGSSSRASVFGERPGDIGDPMAGGPGRVRWRPLSAEAGEWVSAVTGFDLSTLTGSDTAGLEEGGTVYVVESGDSPWAIAKKLTGNGHNYKELLRENSPPKALTSDGGNFQTLSTGERLQIPERWRTAAADEISRRQEEAAKAAEAAAERERREQEAREAAERAERAEPEPEPAPAPEPEPPRLQPAPEPDPEPVTVADDGRPALTPSPGLPTAQPAPEEMRDDVDAVLQAKALLAAWTATDGQSAPGLTDYGRRAEDTSPIWTGRDSFQLAGFVDWSNDERGTDIDSSGDLTQEKLEALMGWAEFRAREPRTIGRPEPEPVTEVVDPGETENIFAFLRSVPLETLTRAAAGQSISVPEWDGPLPADGRAFASRLLDERQEEMPVMHISDSGKEESAPVWPWLVGGAAVLGGFAWMSSKDKKKRRRKAA